MKKRFKYIPFLLVIYSLFSFAELKAQDYQYEIGGMVGTSFYMGDANKTSFYKNSNLSGGIIFRYNRGFRWSVKSNLVMGRISGDTESSGDKFPNNQRLTFSRNFYELGSQVEFNFFNYSDKYAYLDTKRWTPYVFLGMGVTLGTGDKKSIGLNVPFGLGFKYKWTERLNLGLEFSLRKLFSDSFDVTYKNGFNLDDPHGVKSSFLKNKDWYSLTMLSLTWDFGSICKPCLND